MPRVHGRSRRAVGMLLALVAAASGLMLATRAGAATINVSTTAQLVSAVASGTAGDEIVLASGSYTPAATLQVSRDLTIRGPEGDLVVNARISGGNITLSDPPDLFVVDSGVTLTVKNITLTTVANNGKVADIFGGLALENATVSGNNGVSLLVETGGTLNTLNTTLSDNAEFGAIVSGEATATFRNTTIANNTLGGIGNDPGATVTLTNSIVANPGANSTGDCQSPVQTSTNSLSRDSSCGASLTGDPLLATLTNYGGPTSTRALRAGSPALDAGATNCPPVDQRFAARSAAPCDIGAYERDRTAPGLTVPASITVAAPAGATSADVEFTATASEPDGFLALRNPLVCTPASGAAFPVGTTTVECTATNVDGLQTTKSFTVTVTGGGGADTTPPVVTVPSTITRPATSADGAVVEFTASATDAVDGAVAVTCDPASGATFPVGTTTVTCSATDAAGNTGSGSFTVTVTGGGGADTTPPVVTVPSAITRPATSADGAVVEFTASATDAVDGAVAVTCDPASGATFPVGTTTVTCSATDAAGNTGSGSFTVTVTEDEVPDTGPPVVTVPDDITAEATSAQGATVTYTAGATDDVGVTTFACSPASGAVFPLGDTTVDCSAEDAAGNAASASFTVTVEDTTAPAIAGVPAEVTAEATGPGGAAVTYPSPTATDAVDGAVPVTCAPASGAVFPLGPTTVECAAQDAAGNSAEATFTVTVREGASPDTTPPVVTVPPAITRPATSADGAVVEFTASATDAVDGAVAVTCDPASGATFPVGTTTVTCTATDAAGNTGSGTFAVTVTAPQAEDTLQARIDALVAILQRPDLSPGERARLVLDFVRTELRRSAPAPRRAAGAVRVGRPR